MGRPRKYKDDAEKQKAYRKRVSSRNTSLRYYGDELQNKLWAIESYLGGPEDRRARGTLKSAFVEIASNLLVSDRDWLIDQVRDLR